MSIPTEFSGGSACGAVRYECSATPTADVWTASAQPWDVMDPRVPKFPTQRAPG